MTAGSTALLLQTALPMLLFAPVLPEEALPSSLPEPSTLVLRGGTNASQAPQIEYTQHILVPFLKRHFGVDSGLEISLKKRGYYPRGGGELLVSYVLIQIIRVGIFTPSLITLSFIGYRVGLNR